MKVVKTIAETSTGRNTLFQNTGNNEIMTRQEFVNRIKNPSSVYHEDYYVRNINGIETPVSKPDKSTNNNLDQPLYVVAHRKEINMAKTTASKNGNKKKIPKTSAQKETVIDTTEEDTMEAFYERMRRWKALHGGMSRQESDK